MTPTPSNIELLQQLMDNMTDNIFFKDLESRFILINKSCARWNGFKTPEDAIGKSDFDLFTKEFAEAARNDELLIHTSDKPMVSKEEFAEFEDGHTQWVSTTKIPLHDKDNNVIGCIGIGRDITDIKRKEEELTELSARLSETNEQLRLAYEQIADDLRLAANLQHTFLPQRYPRFTSPSGDALVDFHYFYEADLQIGGDYCAIYKIDQDRAALLICDVMGHGIRAALITGIIRALTDNIAHHAPSPSAFLTELNRSLHPLLQCEGMLIFATACCLYLDTRTGELTGAIAGHPVPYLIQTGKNKVVPLPVQESLLGPALAVDQNHDYPDFSIQLEPGDKVVMYTDGICEAMDDSGEEFGTSMFQEILLKNVDEPLQRLFPTLVDAARKHAHSEKLGDDTCLLGFVLNEAEHQT